jgi:hypothetical protein
MNDTKWLAFQSLSRNQNLLRAINTLIAYLKLERSKENDVFSKEEAANSKDTLITFLEEVKTIVEVPSMENIATAFHGFDTRFSSLIHSFQQAREKQSSFRSNLFRTRIDDTIISLKAEPLTAKPELIESLLELESLIESHEAEDYKNVIGDI